MNLSKEAEEYLKQAKAQGTAGNYTKSLELIEVLKAFLAQEAKENSKTEEKIEDLNRKLTNELDELSLALGNPPQNSSFIDKLVARKTELERISEELITANLSEKLDLLNKIDFKWSSKELNSLQKTAYKEYNDLKERFHKAGNSTNPSQFLEFEDSLHTLQAGPRLEYAVDLIRSLQKVHEIVQIQENLHQKEQESLVFVFEKLKDETTLIMDQYLKQASSAKGTDYSGIFTITERKVTSLIKETEDSLDEDSRVFWLKANSLNDTKQQMENTLDNLKNESSAKLSLIESLYQQSNKNEKILEKIEFARQMHNSGEYVNSLRAATQISKELETQEENSGLFVFGLSALAVLAAIAVFIIKQQKPKKELRKLKKITD